MLVGLLNLEPKYKNIALEKLRVYWGEKGAEVEDYLPLRYEQYDKVYCSSIFNYTSKKYLPPKAICGGTGFDLNSKLPLEIEGIEPHLNFGFTTRGCPRSCSFCIVPQKEPEPIIVGSLKSLWDGKSKLIKLFDNNILYFTEHFFSICDEAIKYHLKLDFNQGLDHRFLNQDVMLALKSISHTQYRFAFDSPAYYESVSKAIDLLQLNGINQCLWYVLVGYDTSFQEDLDRLNYLRNRKQRAFVMKYKKDKKYIPLARWANQHHMFYGTTFEQFLVNNNKCNRSKNWLHIEQHCANIRQPYESRESGGFRQNATISNKL